MKKGLYDYKLGEEAEMTGINKDLLGKKAKLVKIAYTYQNKKGITSECALVHKDFIEDEEEDK